MDTEQRLEALEAIVAEQDSAIIELSEMLGVLLQIMADDPDNDLPVVPYSEH